MDKLTGTVIAAVIAALVALYMLDKLKLLEE